MIRYLLRFRNGEQGTGADGPAHPPRCRTFIVSLFVATLFAACQGSNENQPPSRQPRVSPRDEIVLPASSPKRGYIKEAVVEPIPRPLLEPLAGKIAYDETRTVRVRSPITGRVTAMPVSLGSKVWKGDSLLELDSPELGQAQAEYRAALSDLQLSEANHRRTEYLFEKGIVARKELDRVHDEWVRSRVEEERSRLKLAHLGVSGDRTDNRFTLHAQISGLVTEVHANPGMEVRPDLETPLFVISDIARLWVQMDVYEKDLAMIHVGQKVAVTVPAYPGEKFAATVETIGKVVEESTRTVKIRCLLPNPDGRLLPAMYATVEVLAAADDRALVVPLTALYTEGESDWLFVALGDGRYQKRPVDIGYRMKDRAVIHSGLQPGEHIVVEGALLLRSELDNVEQTGEGPS